MNGTNTKEEETSVDCSADQQGGLSRDGDWLRSGHQCLSVPTASHHGPPIRGSSAASCEPAVPAANAKRANGDELQGPPGDAIHHLPTVGSLSSTVAHCRPLPTLPLPASPPCSHNVTGSRAHQIRLSLAPYFLFASARIASTLLNHQLHAFPFSNPSYFCSIFSCSSPISVFASSVLFWACASSLKSILLSLLNFFSFRALFSTVTIYLLQTLLATAPRTETKHTRRHQPPPPLFLTGN